MFKAGPGLATPDLEAKKRTCPKNLIKNKVPEVYVYLKNLVICLPMSFFRSQSGLGEEVILMKEIGIMIPNKNENVKVL